MLLAYDLELRRPACAILAAALGSSRELLYLWDSRLWLTAPTPGLRLYETTAEEVRELARRDNAETAT